LATAVRFSPATRTETEWISLLEEFATQLPPASATPRISLLTPTFNTRFLWLAEAAVSVFDQTLPDWEWILVDDASSQQAHGPLLDALARATSRVRVVRLPENRGISAATNRAWQEARGEWIALLDHDDLLHPEAFAECAARFAHADAVYTDQDKCDEQGHRSQPFAKPGWSPHYFLGVMFVGHLLCVRRAAVRDLGGFDSAFDGVQDFEFFLRYSASHRRVAHVPRVLYHWRTMAGSTSASSAAKSGIDALQERAVNAHLTRLGWTAQAHTIAPHRLALRAAGPLPSITAFCTTDVSIPGVTARIVASGPASLNQAARDASSEFLLFVAPGLQIPPGALEPLLAHTGDPHIAALAPLILSSGGNVWNAGFAVTGAGLLAPQQGQPFEGDGYFGTFRVAREVAAVSRAAMLIRRSTFWAAGGFREWFAESHYDADLCVRLHAQGFRHIVSPAVPWRWLGAPTLPENPLDAAVFADVSPEFLPQDPYHPDRNQAREDSAAVTLWQPQKLRGPKATTS
jgi:glycosyltransferase involved in cell wall biosynthesis